jgi:thiol-disulfide isomerase/thioredoxin
MVRMKAALLPLLALLAAPPASGQDSDALVATADQLVQAARTKAKAEGKSVFVVFHASWCGYCKLLDKMLASPAVAPVWDKHVVTVHLVVMESDDKKALENPGGMDWLKKLGGDGQGIPFSAFLDADGKVLVTSDRLDADGKKLGNIGHPVTPEEQAWWDAMLAKGTGMSPAERSVFAKYLKEQKVGG